MGGFAVRIYALPRNTFDIDLMALVSREELSALYAAAGDLGFTVPPVQSSGWTDSVRGLAVAKFQWYFGTRAIDVDVFLAQTPYQRQIIERRQRHRGEDLEAWFASVEDLILLKLLAYRRKDREDIADILLVQGSLDETYMRTWAAKLNVSAELEAALAENPE